MWILTSRLTRPNFEEGQEVSPVLHLDLVLWDKQIFCNLFIDMPEPKKPKRLLHLPYVVACSLSASTGMIVPWDGDEKTMTERSVNSFFHGAFCHQCWRIVL